MKKSKSQLAGELFKTGNNCAQSVLLTYAEKLGLDSQTAFSLTTGFAGGFAKHGEVCGAVSGAVLVLGMVYGQPGDKPEEAKERVERKVNDFLEEFKSRHSSMLCRDLIDGLILRTPEGKSEWVDKNMHETKCLPAVKTAVEILETLL